MLFRLPLGQAAGLCLAGLLTTTPARANDTTAEFVMGGLQFKSDPDIAMRAEDLYVSLKEVRVAYTFVNTSARDKTVLVAFPMPDIVGANSNDNVGLPTEDAANLFDFHVTADGVAVPLHLETKAMAKDREQTARLRADSIPLMPLAKATNDALDKLSKAKRDEYVALELGRIESYGTGGPMEDHLTANWTLKTTFTWTQTFPAGREIRLVQTYKPSVGGASQTMIGASGWRDMPDMGAYTDKYCMDQGFLGTIARTMKAKGKEYPPFSEQRVSYILTTGANWAGPIGDFRLVVDKGAPANLVSFCGEGVKKIAPTQFEMRKRDYIPTKELDVLILVPTNY